MCGANPNARHTRETIDWLNPRWVAIDRVDQCVESGGVVSSVAVVLWCRAVAVAPVIGRQILSSQEAPVLRAQVGHRSDRPHGRVQRWVGLLRQGAVH